MGIFCHYDIIFCNIHHSVMIGVMIYACVIYLIVEYFAARECTFWCHSDCRLFVKFNRLLILFFIMFSFLSRAKSLFYIAGANIYIEEFKIQKIIGTVESAQLYFVTYIRAQTLENLLLTTCFNLQRCVCKDFPAELSPLN